MNLPHVLKILFQVISHAISWVGYFSCFVVVLYAYFALWVFTGVYLKHFGSQRLSRNHKGCSSVDMTHDGIHLSPPLIVQ